MAKLKIILLAVVALIIGFLLWTPGSPLPAEPPVQPVTQTPAQVPSRPKNTAPAPSPESEKTVAVLSPPLTDAISRVTKKTFGMYISPKDSPVSPERFQGYHTGVDFETFTDEQDTDVAVSALCDGPLLLKKWATGYGGVAVQQCKIEDQEVTVIYGHLKLASIQPAVNDTIRAGESFAVLGKGFSNETDGERKHLHLAIHKGTVINILGYVQSRSSLDEWIDVTEYLKTL